MRMICLELYRLYHDRMYYACFFASAMLGFFFPVLYRNDLVHAVVRLFGAPGYMYAMLCSMAVVCIFTGKDFVYRTFQNKIAIGRSRISLVTSTYLTAIIGSIPVIAVFPIACICSARMLSGWNSERGKLFRQLMEDSRFWLTYSAYFIGVLAVVSICFFITVLSRDLGRSLGVSTAFLVVSVMLSQKITDLESLRYLRPIAQISPLYQLISNIRQATISPADVQTLFLSSAGTILVVFLSSCLAVQRARLK